MQTWIGHLPVASEAKAQEATASLDEHIIAEDEPYRLAPSKLDDSARKILPNFHSKPGDPATSPTRSNTGNSCDFVWRCVSSIEPFSWNLATDIRFCFGFW